MKDLILHALDTATSPENWGATLDTFNSTFGVSASCAFSVHEFGQFSMDFFWSDFFRQNLTPEIIAMMAGGGDEGDRPAYERLFQLPAQKLYSEYVTFDVETLDDLPKSAVRDLTKGWGFCMRTAAALNQTGPWIDGFFCQSRSDAEWKSLVADARTDLILPIFANSISLARTFNALKARYNAALSVLDALGLGVFLVDVRGYVISVNAEGRKIADADDGLSISHDGRMRLVSADQTAELQSMVEAANIVLDGEAAPDRSLMSAQRKTDKYDYLISVLALSDSKAELEPGFKCAFVTVVDPDREDSLSADGVQLLGQLSGAETIIVQLLVKGLRPSDVADQREVSVNTVKSQLQTIYQKLRCSSQADIIRIAAATRLPINKK